MGPDYLDSVEVEMLRMPWTMDAASMMSMPGLKDHLRKRLDKNTAKAAARRAERLATGERISRESLDELYRRGSGREAIVDRWHDRVLLMDWRLGGELRERERARLRYHGWLGDQTENLRAILNR
jgi:hypothetical protein